METTAIRWNSWDELLDKYAAWRLPTAWGRTLWNRLRADVERTEQFARWAGGVLPDEVTDQLLLRYLTDRRRILRQDAAANADVNAVLRVLSYGRGIEDARLVPLITRIAEQHGLQPPISSPVGPDRWRSWDELLGQFIRWKACRASDHRGEDLHAEYIRWRTQQTAHTAGPGLFMADDWTDFPGIGRLRADVLRTAAFADWAELPPPAVNDEVIKRYLAARRRSPRKAAANADVNAVLRVLWYGRGLEDSKAVPTVTLVALGRRPPEPSLPPGVQVPSVAELEAMWATSAPNS